MWKLSRFEFLPGLSVIYSYLSELAQKKPKLWSRNWNLPWQFVRSWWTRESAVCSHFRKGKKFFLIFFFCKIIAFVLTCLLQFYFRIEVPKRAITHRPFSFQQMLNCLRTKISNGLWKNKLVRFWDFRGRTINYQKYAFQFIYLLSLLRTGR